MLNTLNLFLILEIFISEKEGLGQKIKNEKNSMFIINILFKEFLEKVVIKDMTTFNFH